MNLFYKESKSKKVIFFTKNLNLNKIKLFFRGEGGGGARGIFFTKNPNLTKCFMKGRWEGVWGARVSEIVLQRIQI